MRRRKVIWISGAGLLLIVTVFAGWHIIESAEPSAQLLTGQLWQTMSPDAKVAFVWGIGNMVEFERAQVGSPSADTKSFIPFLVKGLKGKSIDEVVHRVDAYYQTHADQIQRPVVDAIFQTMVLPTLRDDTEGGKEK